MKYLYVFGLLTVICLFGFGKLKYDSLVHRVFIYEKSNLDGSNLGKIAVYYEQEDQIESFKWHEGNRHATIVRARMDKLNQTVMRFEAFRMDHLGNKNLNGVLQVDENQNFNIHFGDNQQVYQNTSTNWHSYDFDFASLGYAFRSFTNKEGSISFNILDVDMNESPPKFKDFGSVEMQFIEEEEKYSRTLLKYAIDGPGLDHRGGHIWFDKDGGFLVAFEIDKPDERSYDSGKLLLKEVLEMDESQWSAFKLKALYSGSED